MPQTPTVLNLLAEFHLAESLDIRRVRKRIEVSQSHIFPRLHRRDEPFGRSLLYLDLVLWGLGVFYRFILVTHFGALGVERRR